MSSTFSASFCIFPHLTRRVLSLPILAMRDITQNNLTRHEVTHFHKVGEKWRHPKDMGVPEIERFLTHLATDRYASASTQNQAFSAILFHYRHVLQIELTRIDVLLHYSIRRC